MPLKLHEYMAAAISRRIMDQVVEIAQNRSSSADFARGIGDLRKADVVFKRGNHSPDIQFQHAYAKYPGVIIEIAYSQKIKALAVLAEEYIVGSNGNIRVVIGIDIDYRGTNKASISVWRPHQRLNAAGQSVTSIEQTVTGQVIFQKSTTPPTTRSLSNTSSSSVTPQGSALVAQKQAYNSDSKTSALRTSLQDLVVLTRAYTSRQKPCTNFSRRLSVSRMGRETR